MKRYDMEYGPSHRYLHNYSNSESEHLWEIAVIRKFQVEIRSIICNFTCVYILSIEFVCGFMRFIMKPIDICVLCAVRTESLSTLFIEKSYTQNVYIRCVRRIRRNAYRILEYFILNKEQTTRIQ